MPIDCKKFLCPYTTFHCDFYMRLNLYGEQEVLYGKYISGIWKRRIVNHLFRENNYSDFYRIHSPKYGGDMIEFNSLSLAKEALDKQLIEIGYTLLTEEQAIKYKILI
jgi:hypothetical protein